MKKKFRPGRSDGEKKKVEQGAIIKRGKGLIRTALVYPNTYTAGMSSLGYQAVYKIANSVDQVACERVFWSDPKRHPGPAKSLESGLELHQFDVILFSISFENDFLHLVQLLGEAGIPLRSPDRNHIHPLVVAGGVACFLNPEPIAPFIDCFLLGEAECLLPEFFSYFLKHNKKHRQELLPGIENQIKGAYCPTLHQDGTPFNIDVRYLEHLEDTLTTSVILSSDTAFKDTYLIETLKGCPHGCRFCSAGYIYRPPRIYPEANIIAAIDQAQEQTDKIGLVSSAIADHPQITRICDYALEKQLRISFSSLRADKLDESFLKCLKASNVKTATIAPEAGSQRMRNIINKKLTQDQILDAARKIVSSGIINIRLYFMIGLPFETDSDVAKIVDLALKIKTVFLEESRKKKKIGTLTLSINPFIPKPCTPFQWAAMEKEPVLKKRAGIIRDGLKKTANVKINFESFRNARIHALLSLGDRRTADIIELAAQKNWSSAIRTYQDLVNDTIYKEKAPDAVMPWDFVNSGLKKKFLHDEYLKAAKELKSASCPMSDCSRCRVCMTVP